MSLIEIMRLTGPGGGADPERVSVFGTLIIFLFMGIPCKREFAEESSLSSGFGRSKVKFNIELKWKQNIWYNARYISVIKY